MAKIRYVSIFRQFKGLDQVIHIKARLEEKTVSATDLRFKNRF